MREHETGQGWSGGVSSGLWLCGPEPNAEDQASNRRACRQVRRFQRVQGLPVWPPDSRRLIENQGMLYSNRPF